MSEDGLDAWYMTCTVCSTVQRLSGVIVMSRPIGFDRHDKCVCVCEDCFVFDLVKEMSSPSVPSGSF